MKNFFIFTMLLLAGFSALPDYASADEVAADYSETLTVDFTKHNPDNAVMTKNLYVGDVSVIVNGAGKSSGTSLSDAFYIFTDFNGNDVEPFKANEFGLYVDGNQASVYGLPGYNKDKTYKFSVPGDAAKARQLKFSIGDYYLADNEGFFTVHIIGDVISLDAPKMVYPENGQELDLSGSYMFKVEEVAGSEGYLFGFFQDGEMIYENWRDDKKLSEKGEFAIHADNPYHDKFKAGEVEVWVRAYINSQWSEAEVIKINLASKLADLEPTGIILDASSQVTIGNTVYFHVNIKNNGHKDSEVFNVKWFVDGVNQGYGSHRSVPAGLKDEEKLWLAWKVEEGIHDIVFEVDSDNHVKEGNEGNNRAVKNISITKDSLTRPDLIIKNVYAADLTRNSFPIDPATGEPRLPKLNEEFYIGVFMGNAGKAATAEGYYIRAYYDGHFFDEVYISDVLTPGHLFTAFFQNKIKPFKLHDGAIGPHNIEIFVDSRNNIIESNEQNNIYLKNIKISNGGNGGGATITTSSGTTSSGTNNASTGSNSAIDDDSDKDKIADGSGEEIKDIASNNSNSALNKNNYILGLERTISQLEKQVVDLEKKLTQTIDKVLTQRLKGRILLQVENNGEAWYVDPQSQSKLYMKDGEAAYDIMRALGLGIKNVDLENIPIGVQSELFNLEDTDGDGVPDNLEKAIGTNYLKSDSDEDGFDDKTELLNSYRPDSNGKYAIDPALVNRLKGRILLQVEGHGEAWYVNPADGRRYYLGDGSTAYSIMRVLSLGIKNNDLRKIQVGDIE